MILTTKGGANMEKVYVAFMADKDKVEEFKKICAANGYGMSVALRGFVYDEVKKKEENK